jgi:hypothetical protein
VIMMMSRPTGALRHVSVGAAALAAVGMVVLGGTSPAAAASGAEGDAVVDRCPPAMAQAVREMRGNPGMQQLMRYAMHNPALRQAMQEMHDDSGMAQLMRDCGMRPM